jgi:tocopherol O-methyltransferase
MLSFNPIRRFAIVTADATSAAVEPGLDAAPGLDPAPGLNAAVERYYDTTLDLYEELWGEHVHHGFWEPGERPGDDGADRKTATDRLVRELVSFGQIPSGARVLDVGCGIGGPALYLAGEVGCTIEGITLSASQAQRATEKAAEAGLAGRTNFRQQDAMSNDYPDESFDAVWALESLMHIPDRKAFFAEMFRLLKPGGRIGISDVVAEDHLSPTQRAERGSYVGCIAGALSRAEYVDGLAAAGFTDASVTFTHQAAEGVHAAIIRATKPATATQAATASSACCSPREHTDCCAASAKAGCCGQTDEQARDLGPPPATCGCR